MRGRDGLVTWAQERAHVGPWHGDHRVAYLAPAADGPPPSPAFLHRCLETLAHRGYRQVMTPALAPGDQDPYRAVGFEEHERLHLLAHDLVDMPDRPTRAGVRLRRARHAHRPEVLEVDGDAFQPFWRLDNAGLDDALHATPKHRFRVALGPKAEARTRGAVARRVTRSETGSPWPERGPKRNVLGYAVCGYAATYGYVQRLAVQPGEQRSGIGSALVVDGLRWMRRHGVERAVVNTQLENHPALSLYERLGFRRVPSGLAVLRRDIV